jgi:hypothetical protein
MNQYIFKKSIVTWDTVLSSRTSHTVSEDHTAYIFRVEEYDKQVANKKLATSKTNPLRTAGHTTLLLDLLINSGNFTLSGVQ